MRAGLLTLLLLCSSGALAAPTVDDGVAAFERGDYRKSREILADLVAANAAPAGKEAIARLYLAASHHALGDSQRAYQHLLELRRQHPEQQVDPLLFVPEFVALAVGAQEQVRKEQAAAGEPAQAAPPQEPEPAVAAEPVEEPRTLPTELRVGVLGFSDVMGQRSLGALAVATFGAGPVEGGLRLVLGQYPAVGAEAAWRFGAGPLQPRLGLRGTVLPVLAGGPGLGGGAFVGARVPVAGRLSLLADAGVEALSAPEGFQPLAVMLSVGLDYAVIGGGL